MPCTQNRIYKYNHFDSCYKFIWHLRSVKETRQFPITDVSLQNHIEVAPFKLKG